MKKTIFLAIITSLMVFSIQTLSAQGTVHSMNGQKARVQSDSQQSKIKGSQADSIKVSGSCGLCKTRIETAAMKVSGVKSATWDEKTKILIVTYIKESRSNEVQQAVAKSGHDTPKYKASREAYNALPGCCKYREE